MMGKEKEYSEYFDDKTGEFVRAIFEEERDSRYSPNPRDPQRIQVNIECEQVWEIIKSKEIKLFFCLDDEGEKIRPRIKQCFDEWEKQLNDAAAKGQKEALETLWHLHLSLFYKLLTSYGDDIFIDDCLDTLWFEIMRCNPSVKLKLFRSRFRPKLLSIAKDLIGKLNAQAGVYYELDSQKVDALTPNEISGYKALKAVRMLLHDISFGFYKKVFGALMAEHIRKDEAFLLNFMRELALDAKIFAETFVQGCEREYFYNRYLYRRYFFSHLEHRVGTIHFIYHRKEIPEQKVSKKKGREIIRSYRVKIKEMLIRKGPVDAGFQEQNVPHGPDYAAPDFDVVKRSKNLIMKHIHDPQIREVLLRRLDDQVLSDIANSMEISFYKANRLLAEGEEILKNALLNEDVFYDE